MGLAAISWSARRVRPTLTEGTVLVLGLIEIGHVLAWTDPFRGWDLPTGLYLVAYGALAVVHAGELWLPRASRSA